MKLHIISLFEHIARHMVNNPLDYIDVNQKLLPNDVLERLKTYIIDDMWSCWYCRLRKKEECIWICSNCRLRTCYECPTDGPIPCPVTCPLCDKGELLIAHIKTNDKETIDNLLFTYIKS